MRATYKFLLSALEELHPDDRKPLTPRDLKAVIMQAMFKEQQDEEKEYRRQERIYNQFDHDNH